MTWSLLAHQLNSGANAVTTTAIDSTNADQILVFASSYDGVAAPTILDSAGNTWLQIEQFDYPTAFAYLTIWRAQGPVVTSATHTATITTTGGVPTAVIVALSGSDAGTYEVIATNTNSSTANFNTGSVTPGENNALVLSMVVGLGAGMTSIAATSPQTLIDHVNYVGGTTFGTAVSYYAQPTAGAINPAFTWTSSAAAMGATVVLKPATGTTINIVGVGSTSASGTIVSTTAETKALGGIGSTSAAGTVIAGAGGTVSVSGAQVAATAGSITANVSARTISIIGVGGVAAAGGFTILGPTPPVVMAARGSLLTRRDWTQEAGVVFSGGRWLTDFSPLQTIDPDYAICASSAQPQDTTFDCDLGTTRLVSVIHFQRLRVSWGARMRVRIGTDATFASTTYDSGVVAGWVPVQAQFDSHPFGDWSFAGLVDPEEVAALGFARWFLPSAPVSARYARVEIWDRLAVYFPQVGYFGLCEAWELPVDPNVGWSVESIGGANLQTAEYGSRFVSAYDTKRRVNLGFDLITHNDFVERIMSILPRAGGSIPAAVIVTPPDSAEYAWRERIAVYGLLAQADITAAHYSMYSFPLTLDQL